MERFVTIIKKVTDTDLYIAVHAEWLDTYAGCHLAEYMMDKLAI